MYENIFTSEYLRRIDEESSTCGRAHIAFNLTEPRTDVERAISSILLELSSSSSSFSPPSSSVIVEYWWREEWLSLDLHRDVDEELALLNSTFRFPLNAHVLYLSIGAEVNGPTVVFEEKVSHEHVAAVGSAKSSTWIPQLERMTIVPAVTGRLLRFDGHLLHAVPRPALAYLDAEEGGSNLEVWTRRRPNPNDPADPERTSCRRSVLLFNTWTVNHDDSGVEEVGGGGGPLNVRRDISNRLPAAAAPVGPQHKPFSQWTVVDALPFEGRKRCQDQSSNDNHNGDDDGSGQVHMSICLLGNLARRGRASRTLDALFTPRAAKEAFLQLGGPPRSFPITWKGATS